MLPASPTREILFYDGHCALCHGAVKFVLKHDRSGKAFRFAPLQGATFQSRISAGARADLPDSIVVLTERRNAADAFECLRSHSAASGRWLEILGGVLAVVPRPLRDVVYHFVARTRYRVFGTRDDLCPLVPPDLRARFNP